MPTLVNKKFIGYDTCQCAGTPENAVYMVQDSDGWQWDHIIIDAATHDAGVGVAIDAEINAKLAAMP
jgi:hypothetical protein